MAEEVTIGALFAGYFGLDLAVEAVFGGSLAWYAEFDGLPTRKKPQVHGAAAIGAHHHPDVPNLGDVTAVDWTRVPRVTILTGGSPCQDLSHAGKRKGMTEGTRSNLWVAMREAIAVLQPDLVVWENVRGATTTEADSDLESDPGLLGSVRRRDGEPVLRAAGRVLGDLAELGYDARWHSLLAADVGAPHPRWRIFVLAHRRGVDPARYAPGRWERDALGAVAGGGEGQGADRLTLLGTPMARDGKGVSADTPRLQKAAKRGKVEAQVALLKTPNSNLAINGGSQHPDKRKEGGHGPTLADEVEHLLPTPNAALGDGGQTSRSGDRADEPLLGNIGALLPTPRSAEADHSGRAVPAKPGQQKGLTETVNTELAGRLLPTPAVNDMGANYTPDEWDAWTEKMKAEHGNGNGHGPSLAVEAQRLADGDQLLPTPMAHGSGNTPEEHLRKKPGREVVTDLGIVVENGLLATGGRLPQTSDDAVTAPLDDPSALFPTPRATRGGSGTETMYALGGTRSDDDRPQGEVLLPTPVTTDAAGSGSPEGSPYRGTSLTDATARQPHKWGQYAAAIARWEQATGRPAPDPTEPGSKGQPRLSPRFVEWMMGLPPGWVTDVPGVTRNEQLKALGNGVVPQQAAAALRIMLTWKVPADA